MIRTYYLSDGVSMVTETSGTRTGTLDSEYENIGIIPIYFVLHWLLGLFFTGLHLTLACPGHALGMLRNFGSSSFCFSII